MGGIFVSYRRSDSAGWTGHLVERLEVCFGQDQIFMDIEKIEAGTDFIEAIESAVSSCSVLLAVIGPNWLGAVDHDGTRRLDSPEDYIRLEIATALKRTIRVIPVLVGGAAMPASTALPDDLKLLSRRQAHELTDNRWDYDTEELVKAIEKAGIKRRDDVKPGPVPPPVTAKKVSIKAVASMIMSVLICQQLLKSGISYDTKIGSLVLVLAALGLAIAAYYDAKLLKIKGKGQAVAALVLASLTLLVNVGTLTSHPDTQKQTQVPPPEPGPLPSRPPEPAPAPAPGTGNPQVLLDLNGVWFGTDGLTYSVQQQGNRVNIAGGYPNQALIVTASGTINGRSLELTYLRIPDGTNGRVRFWIANPRSLQGQYQNFVTGEAGAMSLTR